MSNTDNMTDEIIELYNIEREILWQEAKARGFEITTEELRERARKILRSKPSFHSYEGNLEPPEIEKYDE